PPKPPAGVVHVERPASIDSSSRGLGAGSDDSVARLRMTSDSPQRGGGGGAHVRDLLALHDVGARQPQQANVWRDDRGSVMRKNLYRPAVAHPHLTLALHQLVPGEAAQP